MKYLTFFFPFLKCFDSQRGWEVLSWTEYPSRLHSLLTSIKHSGKMYVKNSPCHQSYYDTPLIKVAKFIEPCCIIKNLTGLYPWFLGDSKSLEFSKWLGGSLLSVVSPWDHTWVCASEVNSEEPVDSLGMRGLAMLGRSTVFRGLGFWVMWNQLNLLTLREGRGTEMESNHMASDSTNSAHVRKPNRNSRHWSLVALPYGWTANQSPWWTLTER